MKMEIQTSKYWLLTSPHISDTKIQFPLQTTYEQASQPVLPYVEQIEHLIETFETGSETPTTAINSICDPVYDYILGVEDGNHLHAFLEFSSPTSLTGYRKMLDKWNMLMIKETDQDVEQAKHYVKKSGFWFQKHSDLPNKYSNDFPDWKPWQQKAISRLETQNDREILFVYDPYGNKGKTFLALWFSSRCRACYLPTTLKEPRDLLRAAHNNLSSCYFLDFPKCVTKANIPRVFAAIESIKNGHVYDDRYKYQFRYMDPPKVCVFGNFEPNKTMLSKDRWDIMKVW